MKYFEIALLFFNTPYVTADFADFHFVKIVRIGETDERISCLRHHNEEAFSNYLSVLSQICFPSCTAGQTNGTLVATDTHTIFHASQKLSIN